MEAYDLNNGRLLIEKNQFIYYFAGYSTGLIAIDKFEIVDEQFKYIGVAYSDFEAKPFHIFEMVNIKSKYLKRNRYPRIKIEQLLTHQNPQYRKAIKKLLDGSI